MKIPAVGPWIVITSPKMVLDNGPEAQCHIQRGRTGDTDYSGRKSHPPDRRRVRPWQLESMEAKFTAVHGENTWRSAESVSGRGSTFCETEAIRRELPGLIEQIAARSILDTVLQALIRLTLVKPFLGFLGLPGFAHGGRHPNAPFIAGELGPELVIPDRPGTVIPNNQLGGLGGFRQEFNFPLAFPTQLEAFVRNVAGPAGRDAAAQVLRATRGKI